MLDNQRVTQDVFRNRANLKKSCVARDLLSPSMSHANLPKKTFEKSEKPLDRGRTFDDTLRILNMKYELTEEQFDSLRTTLVRLTSVIQSNQSYFKDKGWDKYANLLGGYVTQAEDVLDTTTYSKVKRTY